MSFIETTAEFARQNPKVAGAIAVAGVVATAMWYNNAVPEEIVDDCSDATHQLVVVTHDVDPLKIYLASKQDTIHYTDHVGRNSFFESIADDLTHQRGYTQTAHQLESANPDLIARDTDGKTIDPPAGAYCVVNAAPVPSGFESVEDDQTLQSTADKNRITVDQLRSLNPILSEVDKDKPLPEGFTVRITESLDTNYILQQSPGTLNEVSKDTGVAAVDLVSHNVAVFASGGTIDEGSDAFLPFKQTRGLTELGLEPADIVTAYQSADAYAIQTPPEVLPPTPPAPAEVAAIPEGLNQAQVDIINSIPNRTPEQRQFLQDIYTSALRLQAEGYTINAGAFAAQIICESNWGRSQLTLQDHNYAGLKAPRGTPAERIAYWPTQEFIGGQYVTVNAAFLHADSMQQGLQDVADFWRKPWYDAEGVNAYMTPAEGQSQRDAAIAIFNGLREGGWATSPTYVDTLTAIYDVNRFQDIANAAA